MVARRDPARRYRRRVRRVRVALGTEGVLGAGTGWLAATVGVAPGLEGAEVLWGGLAVVFGVGVLRSGARLWRLHSAGVPDALPGAPRRGTAQRAAVDRLTATERALAGLLDQIDA